mgnify:FL=1
MSEEEVIPVHKDSWSNRELLQRVISRHCHVLEDIGGRTPTYLVAEKENEDMHEVLIAINHHLEKLSYSARLYPDDPWILQLIPHPTNQWPSPKFIASMWLLSLLTTLLAGEMWMEGARPEGGWFFSNVTLDAFVGYTVPLFGALILASFIQKRVASQKGVHLPHLFPIPGPAMIWWPFGILGFASLPRSDARLWPDRSSLGNSALSAPLVMILLGMVFTILGLKLTPDVVSLDSAPLSVELPLLIQLIGLSIEGDLAMILKTSWAHPLTRAGMTLTFIGWISLLPIPTFPGGRILIARMGIPEARSGSTQVMLLMVVLLFAFLFGAFSAWSIWVPVVALCASLLITKGSDPRLPIILDDFKGLPDVDHRRIGVILFLSFMLALPAGVPFYEDEGWDDEIKWSIGEDELKIKDGWFNQTFTVSNPSLIVQEWNIAFIGGLFGSSDLVEIDCKSGELESASCHGEVDPLDTIKLKFSFQWQEDWNSTSMELLWQVEDRILSHNVVPNQSIFPIGSWQFNGDMDDPKSCIELNTVTQASINVSPLPNFATWSNIDADGNLTVSKESSEVCIDALSGDDMSWLKDNEFQINQVPFKADYFAENVVVIPEEGVILDEQELMFSQSILALNHQENCLQLGTPSPPLAIDNGTRVWNMSILPIAVNYLEDSNESIRLFADDGSVIADCQNPHAPSLFNVQTGPLLTVGFGENRTQKWLGNVEVLNNEIVIENLDSSDVSLNIEFDGNGPQWAVSNDITLVSGQITNVSAIAPETGISYAWLELNDNEVILHLVNHEV